MIRLFAIRSYIAALKHGIAISNKLKPRTWVYLAVTQALLAALCFWGYRQLPNREARLAKQSTAQQYSVLTDNSGSEYKCLGIDLSPYVTDPDSPTIKYITPGAVAAQGGLNFVWSDSSVSTFRTALSTGTYHAYFYLRAPAPTAKTFWSLYVISHMMETSAIARQTVPPEIIVIQLSSPENKSQIDAWLKSMMLIQGIFMTIGSALASVFAWLSYRRGKADLKLKELQIREMEIRIENMERDRARAVQEAERSGIILLR